MGEAFVREVDINACTSYSVCTYVDGRYDMYALLLLLQHLLVLCITLSGARTLVRGCTHSCSLVVFIDVFG